MKTWVVGILILLGINVWTEAGAAATLPLPACPASPDGVTTYHDYVDTVYGAAAGTVVRQIRNPAGVDRNLYHFRNPFNANNTYMMGVRELVKNDQYDHDLTHGAV